MEQTAERPSSVEAVTAAEYALAKSKAKQERIALQLAEGAEEDGLYRLMKAAARSIRLVNEDLLRESGYMLPQSANTHALLEELISNPPTKEFPLDAAKELLRRIPCNETGKNKKIVRDKQKTRWEQKAISYKSTFCKGTW